MPEPLECEPVDDAAEARREAGQPCQLCGIEVDGRGTRRTTSSALLGTKTELHILHNGDVYRLTLTRSGKLLLQK